MTQPPTKRTTEQPRAPRVTDSFSNRAYFLCVVGLATFLILVLIWPKSPVVPSSAATLEINTSVIKLDDEILTSLLDETILEVTAPQVQNEIAALCWAQNARELAQASTMTLADSQDWLKGNLRIEPSDSEITNYRLVTVDASGLTPRLITAMVNQTALELLERLNAKIRQHELFEQWDLHQADLEDALRVRRHWLEQLDSAIANHATTLTAIERLDASPQSPLSPAQFVSTQESNGGNQSQPVDGMARIETYPNPRIELLEAEIEMRREQLQTAALQQQWTTFNPEYQKRAREIQGLIQELDRLHQGLASPAESVGQIRTQENEFLKPAPAPQPGTPGLDNAIENAMNRFAEIEQVKNEAIQWLGQEEQLNAQLQSWIRGQATSPQPPVKLLEVASMPQLTAQALPGAHWLAISLVSLTAIGLAGMLLARQPTRVTNTHLLSEELALPVLGQLDSDAPSPITMKRWLKAQQGRLQLCAEVIILAMLLVIVIGMTRDTRLLHLLLENPLDGFARAIQMFG